MLERTYDAEVCSVARALEVVGERWTLLIVRDAFHGVRRFEDFQRRLGLARNVLTDRLQRLCALGVFERVRYQERPGRHEYRLTDMGRDLWPVIIALRAWGDRHMAPAGPPRLRRAGRAAGGLRRLRRAPAGARLRDPPRPGRPAVPTGDPGGSGRGRLR